MIAAIKSLGRATLFRLGLFETYLRYYEWRASRGHEAPPVSDAEGVPIPPLQMMIRTVGHADWRAFLATGEAHARTLARYAGEAGVDFASAHRVLDLGCGCGRVIRHMPKLTRADLFGSDRSRALVSWCERNLHGSFVANTLHPPLAYPDEHFDVVYLLSVFTHLRIPTQRLWLAELSRIGRPDGAVLITFHDEDHPALPDTTEARTALRESGFYVHNDHAEGSNLVALFQTREYVRSLFGGSFERVRIVPSSESKIGQTLAVLSKGMA